MNVDRHRIYLANWINLILVVIVLANVTAAQPARRKTFINKEPVTVEEWYLPTEDKAAPSLYVF
jgi:hypothetical protein